MEDISSQSVGLDWDFFQSSSLTRFGREFFFEISNNVMWPSDIYFS